MHANQRTQSIYHIRMNMEADCLCVDVVVCNMCHNVEGMRLRGCYYLFGKITAMVEVHEDHRLVQLQERQAADESRSLISRFESLFGLLDWSCHPHRGVKYLKIRTCM